MSQPTFLLSQAFTPALAAELMPVHQLDILNQAPFDYMTSAGKYPTFQAAIHTASHRYVMIGGFQPLEDNVGHLMDHLGQPRRDGERLIEDMGIGGAVSDAAIFAFAIQREDGTTYYGQSAEAEGRDPELVALTARIFSTAIGFLKLHYSKFPAVIVSSASGPGRAALYRRLLAREGTGELVLAETIDRFGVLFFVYALPSVIDAAAAPVPQSLHQARTEQVLRDAYDSIREYNPEKLKWEGYRTWEEFKSAQEALDARDDRRQKFKDGLDPKTSSLEPEDLAAQGLDEDDFLNVHRTGHISTHSYADFDDPKRWQPENLDPKYHGPGGYKDPHVRSTYPVKRGEIITRDGRVLDVLSRDEKLQYVATDAEGDIIRDDRGEATYLSDEDIKAKNLPATDTSMMVFDGEQLAAQASDEWGTDGIWVNPDYRRQGIGVQLLRMFRKQFPYPRWKVGQMTIAGEELTRAYYRKYKGEAVKQSLHQGFYADVTTKYAREQGKDLNGDGSLTVYHGTSAANESSILRTGKFRGYPFFALDPETARKFAGQAAGRPVVMELHVDPDAILPTGGYFSSRDKGLFLDEDGSWRLPAAVAVSSAAEPLLAPDGSPSLLSPQQWQQVRTPEFKAWFGDWENDPANASKALSPNGEPAVVYHGTFKAFPRVSMNKGAMKLFWVASDRNSVAEGRSGAASSKTIMELFINVRHPADWNQYEKLVLDQFASRGLDGAILSRKGGFDAFVFKPNQVKSASTNKGRFRPDSAYLNQNKSDDKFAKLFYDLCYGPEGGFRKLQDLDGYPRGLDMENVEIVGLYLSDDGHSKAWFEAGGDWQQMVRFGVEEKQGKLKIVDLYDGGPSQKAPELKAAIARLKAQYGAEALNQADALTAPVTPHQVPAVDEEELAEYPKEVFDELNHYLGRNRQQLDNFYRWFGNSKAVDGSGRPLVFYHGTTSNFTEFDKDKVGSRYALDNHGIFFSRELSLAEGHAQGNVRGDSPLGNIKPVYLRLQKPLLDADVLPLLTESMGYKTWEEVYSEYADVGDMFDLNRHEIMALAQEKGCDGIFLQGTFAAVFDPSQVKSSIGNNGAYGMETNDLSQDRKFPLTLPPKSFIGFGITPDQIKENPHYAAAKAGSAEEAVALITELYTPETAESLKRLSSGIIFVAPHAEEMSGRNAIPQVLANFCARLCSGRVEDGIVQTNRPYHTGANMMERIASRVEFTGAVEKGGRYALVGDNVTSGGTLADLGSYIQENGGQVVAVIALTTSSRSSNMEGSRRFRDLVERRFGDVVLKELGINPQALTEAEAQYLAGFKDADELRGRIARSRQDRSERLRSKGIRESAAPEGLSEPFGIVEPLGAPSVCCPKCKSTNIIQTKSRSGPARCMDCGFEVKDKAQGNPFFIQQAATGGGFQEWFQGSVVVSSSGSPLLVYHGTSIAKADFRRDRSSDLAGIYFTPDKATAQEYAELDADDGGTPYVISAYLSIQNPFHTPVGKDAQVLSPAQRDSLEAMGYDGVVGKYPDGSEEIVAFRPDQVRVVTSMPVNSSSQASGSTLTLWHGGNLDREASGKPVGAAATRWEYGPGLYLTTNYQTAVKYAKGGRRLYRITIRKGTEANEVMIPLAEAQEFYRRHLSGPKRKDAEGLLSSRPRKEGVSASTFTTILINVKGLTLQNKDAVRAFLSEHGADYEIIKNAFGWGETMVVLYNMNLIVNKEVITAKTKITEFDLPTEFQSPVQSYGVQTLQIQMQAGALEELEHTKGDLDAARKIAMDHLNEDPDYYIKLKAAGLMDNADALKRMEVIAASRITSYGVQTLFLQLRAGTMEEMKKGLDLSRAQALARENLNKDSNYYLNLADDKELQDPTAEEMLYHLTNAVAYHGTLKDVDSFSTDYSGSGMGSQSYGWGIYMASSKAVADYYRKFQRPSADIVTWSAGPLKLKSKGEYLDYSPDGTDTPYNQALASLAEELLADEDQISKAYEEGSTRGAQALMLKIADGVIDYYGREDPTLLPYLKIFRKNIEVGLTLKADFDEGHVITADIPEPSEFLDWDKAFSEQPPAVKAALKGAGVDKDYRRNFSDFASPQETRGRSVRGSNIYAFLSMTKGSDKAASQYLLELGIPGIKYWDEINRDGIRGGENFVVFDASRVRIKQAFNQLVVAAPLESITSAETQTGHLPPVIARITQTPAFKAWFGESKVVYPDTGEPMPVFHGSTHAFEEFKIELTAKDNYWGRGFYFTTSASDASTNYSTIMGPDFHNRVGRRVDDLKYDFDEDPMPFLQKWLHIMHPEREASIDFSHPTEAADLLSQMMPGLELTPDMFEDPTDGVWEQVADVVLEPVATAELKGETMGMVYYVFLRCVRPFQVSVSLPLQTEVYNEETEDYDEDPEGSEVLAQIHDAFMEAVGWNDDNESLWGGFLEAAYADRDAIDWGRGLEYLRNQSIEDDEGEMLMPGSILADIAEALDYDGILQDSPARDFKGMAAVTPDTKHWVVWDPRQIKSVYNRGGFDPKDKRMNQSRKPLSLKQARQASIWKRPGQVYGWMSEEINCGPFDGGCLLVAQALQRVLGGEVWVLVRADDVADHAMLKTPQGTFIDSSGEYSEAEVVQRFNREENARTVRARPFEVGDLEDAADLVTNQRIDRVIRFLKQSAPSNLNEAFRAWFGDSKAVDRQGNPAVCFHGTWDSFNEFDPAKVGQRFGMDKYGIFFTASAEDANHFTRDYYGKKGKAEHMGGDIVKGSQIKPVYLRIERPLTDEHLLAYLKTLGWNSWAEVYEEQFDSPGEVFDSYRKEIHQLLIDGGHDGIWLQDGTFAMILDPKQAKSIYNAGTWSRDTANLAQSQMPVISEDDEVPGSLVAFFEPDEAHIKWALTSSPRTIWILSVYADAGGNTRGRDMVRWLKSRYPDTPVKAAEVAMGAEGFWDKMQEEGLIQGWSEQPLRRKITPLHQSQADDDEHARVRDRTGFWGKQGAGALILCSATGRLLMPLRSDAVMEPGTWGTWGGAIDEGQTPEQSVTREIREEAGYAGAMELVPLMVFQDPGSGFRYHNFLAIVPREFKPALNWETERAQWRDLSNIPSPLHFGLKALLGDGQSLEKIRGYVDQTESIESAASTRLWYRGSNAADPLAMRKDEGGNANEQYGPGLYFTDKPEIAAGYGKVTEYRIATSDGFSTVKTGVKSRRFGIGRLIKKAPDYLDTLTNFDEDPVRAFNLAVEGVIDYSEGFADALQLIAADFYKGAGDLFIQNCSAMGIKGIIMDQSGVKFLVLYDPYKAYKVRDLEPVTV